MGAEDVVVSQGELEEAEARRDGLHTATVPCSRSASMLNSGMCASRGVAVAFGALSPSTDDQSTATLLGWDSLVLADADDDWAKANVLGRVSAVRSSDAFLFVIRSPALVLAKNHSRPGPPASWSFAPSSATTVASSRTDPFCPTPVRSVAT